MKMTLPSTLKCRCATSTLERPREKEPIGKTGKYASHKVRTMRYKPKLKTESKQSSNLHKTSSMSNVNAMTKLGLKMLEI